MTATLRWNRLSITAESEEEFISAVAEFFPQLVELPYDELEMDITKSSNLSEDAFRSIALKLVSGEASDKKILIRIPDTMERYFKHSSLFRVVDVDVVHRLVGDKKDKYTREIIKRNIEKGEIDAEAEEQEAEEKVVKAKEPARAEYDLTERAPAAAGARARREGESGEGEGRSTLTAAPGMPARENAYTMRGIPPDVIAPEARGGDELVLDGGGAGDKGDLNMDSVGAKAAPQGTVADVGWLVDSETGNRHEVRTEIVIGREAPATVLYQIPTISKKHFAIRKQDSGFVIEDMHSTNGTYLNGLPVHDPVPLRDGDEIVVAITLKHPKGARIFHFSTKPA